jgi:hypothetical protein
MAHVDAVMTVFLVGCLFVYQQGVELGSWPVKLGAGALWGLSIASKATAVLFIPILLGWRFLRKERWPFSWSDVWALLLGQAVLAALFTRLWHHKSFYARDLGIKSVFADTLYEAGIWLQSHPFIALFFSISLAAVVILSKWRLLKHSGGLLFVLSSALILFPQVPETLWRFWLRIAGLKGVQHNAYGFVFPPPPDGYIGIYTNCFPVLSIVAFSLGGVLALCRYSKASSERDRFILWMVIAVVLWTLPLSTSGKQSSRYILAVVPGICVVAAYGLDWMMARVLGRYALLGALLLTTVSSGGVFLKWYPDYHLYHNWLRGGLLGAAERGNLLGGARGASLSSQSRALSGPYAACEYSW